MRRYIPELKFLRKKDFIVISSKIPDEILCGLRYFLGIGFAKSADSTALYVMSKGAQDFILNLDRPTLYTGEDSTGVYFESPREYWGRIEER